MKQIYCEKCRKNIDFLVEIQEDIYQKRFFEFNNTKYKEVNKILDGDFSTTYECDQGHIIEIDYDKLDISYKKRKNNG